MDIFNILDKNLCKTHIAGKNKAEIVKKIAEVAVQSDKIGEATEALVAEKLLEREKQGSTGFGNGIAIPHARVAGMTDFLLFILVSRRGVDFDAMDKKKVNILFVILGPETEVPTHLKLLASISRVLGNSNVKSEILNAYTSEGIYEAFIRNTRVVEKKSGAKQKMKLLYIILYFDELMYSILEFFIEIGIEGATIFDTFGMGEYISNIPLFAEFIGFMKENKNQSKTIMALVPENDIDEVIDGIEQITGDLDKKEGAMIFTTDVSFYKGTMRMM